MRAETDTTVSPRSVDIDVLHLDSHREPTGIGMPSDRGDKCKSFLVDIDPLPVGHANADAFIVSDGDYDSQSFTSDTSIESHGIAKSGDIVNHIQDRLISLSFKIALDAESALVAILQLHFPADTSADTVIQSQIKEVSGGTYYHFGLANIINKSKNGNSI